MTRFQNRSVRTSCSTLIAIACLIATSGSALGQGNGNPPARIFSGALEPVEPGPQGTSARAGILTTGGLASGTETLELALPDGNIVTLVRDGFERRGAGNVTWRGRSAGEPDSRAVLTLNRGFVSGRIRIGLDLYEIRPGNGPRHVVERLDPARFAPETSIAVEREFEPGGAEAVPDAETPMPSSDPAVPVHVLVTYSPQARIGAGGSAQIESQIQNAIDGTNTALIDSNMVSRLVLVHTEEVNRNDSTDLSTDLNWLGADSQVAALRDQHGADLVAHMVESAPGYCGIGYVQRNPGPGFAAYAFSVTVRSCISNLSFAHEIGHNLGFEHNPENSNATPSSASYPWSFGYWDVNAGFRTVMSYQNPCPSCPREENFSNPDIFYSSAPMGVDGAADNARTGDLTSSIVADFRASVAPPPSSGPVRFAVIGDYGVDNADEQAVAALVGNQLADFVITVGDNRYDSLSFDQAVGTYYCDFLNGIAGGPPCPAGNSQPNAFFPSPGNHDYTDGAGINEYLNYFDLPGSGIATSDTSLSERYYDFVQGPVHFFVIDSQLALTSPASYTQQQQWLEAALDASTTPWQVVYLHHPPYSSGSHGSETNMQWPFAAWGADAVIAGHEHSYERLLADGIPYFVNGLGGRPIYGFGSPLPETQARYNAAFGAMFVDATETTMTFQFLNTSAAVVDAYTLPDANTPPVFTSDPIVESDAAQGSVYSSTIADAASDADGDLLSFTKLGGPAWLAVAPGGTLTGTPGPDDLGLNSWPVEVSDGRGGSDTAVLEIDVVAPPLYVDHVAVGSIATWGSVAGSYADTHQGDTSAQSITEVHSGGKPSSRYSRLRFDWVFDLSAGNSATVFANAWASSGDGDTFMLSYSTDGSLYAPMFTIDDPADDDGYAAYPLPNGTSGTVYLRVEDTDRTPGNLSFDTVTVDHLFIRTENGPIPSPPSAPTDLTATGSSWSTVALAWIDTSDNELGFEIERSIDQSFWVSVGPVGADTTSFQDEGLSADTTYYYRVQAYNTGGQSGFANASTTTPSGGPGGMHVADLAGSSNGGKRWTARVAIRVEDGGGNPVSSATVFGDWDGDADSCTTLSDGTCTVEKRKLSQPSVTWSVSDIAHASLSYDAGANAETSIVVP